MEEGLNIVEDVIFHQVRIFLIEKGWNFIWSWCFESSKVEDSEFNLFICHWCSKSQSLLVGYLWDRQGFDLLKNIVNISCGGPLIRLLEVL